MQEGLANKHFLGCLSEAWRGTSLPAEMRFSQVRGDKVIFLYLCAAI